MEQAGRPSGVVDAAEQREPERKHLWLASNKDSFDAGQSGWGSGPATTATTTTVSGATPVHETPSLGVASVASTPPAALRAPRSSRWAIGGFMAAVLVAGSAGGAAGSLLTAATLRGAIPAIPGISGIPETTSIAPASPVANSPLAPEAQAPSTAVPENAFKAIYRAAGPAVVSVQTAQAGRQGRSQRAPSTPSTPDSQDLPLLPRGEGTGFIVDEDGHILTNNHVVDGASRVTVQLQDGTQVLAQVVGTDPASDLALLKADLPKGRFAAVPLGNSDAVEPGDAAIAIGTPFGLKHTITAGIVSAVNRDFGAAAGRPMRGLIQTDAPINPGNSGGPLLNLAGEVIGITTAIESPVRGSVGVGFAIPINAAKRLLPQLLTGATVEHAWIGISGVALTGDVIRDAGLTGNVTEGVLIAQTVSGGPAAKAGLRGGSGESTSSIPRGGDIILAIDGRPVRAVQDISNYLDTKKPGEVITVTILRDGTKQEVGVTVAPWPANARES